jgi:hypothetical protein
MIRGQQCHHHKDAGKGLEGPSASVRYRIGLKSVGNLATDMSPYFYYDYSYLYTLDI